MPRDPVAPMSAGMFTALVSTLSLMASAWFIVAIVQRFRAGFALLDRNDDETAGRLALSAWRYNVAGWVTAGLTLPVLAVGLSIYGLQR